MMDTDTFVLCAAVILDRDESPELMKAIGLYVRGKRSAVRFFLVGEPELRKLVADKIRERRRKRRKARAAA